MTRARSSRAEFDLNPQWSRDGLWVAFERKVKGDSGPGLLFVSRHDGSELTQVTPEAFPTIHSYTFSPDGMEILIGVGLPEAQRIWIAAADGSGIRQLDLSTSVVGAAWRPPNGSEILMMDGVGGIYAMDATSEDIRQILASSPGRNRTDPRWSPDGSLISFIEWSEYADGLSSETHIMAADGTGNRMLPIPPEAVWQASWTWSNDGRSSEVSPARPWARRWSGSGIDVAVTTPWYPSAPRVCLIPASGAKRVHAAARRGGPACGESVRW